MHGRTAGRQPVRPCWAAQMLHRRSNQPPPPHPRKGCPHHVPWLLGAGAALRLQSRLYAPRAYCFGVLVLLTHPCFTVQAGKVQGRIKLCASRPSAWNRSCNPPPPNQVCAPQPLLLPPPPQHTPRATPAPPRSYLTCIVHESFVFQHEHRLAPAGRVPSTKGMAGQRINSAWSPPPLLPHVSSLASPSKLQCLLGQG